MKTDFVIRSSKGSDLPFIYSTWLESYRYDSNFGKSHRNTIFFEDYRKVVDLILLNSETLVAASSEEPDIIYGYLVKEKHNVLHYIFVKGPFRRWGVGSALFTKAFPEESLPVSYTHKTYMSIPILEKIDNNKLLFRGSSLLKSLEDGDKQHA